MKQYWTCAQTDLTLSENIRRTKRNRCGNARLRHCGSLERCIIVTLSGTVAQFPRQNGEIGGIKSLFAR